LRLVASAFIRYYHICKYLGVKNLLASKHYPEQVQKAIDYAIGTDNINPLTKGKDQGVEDTTLIVDSGAFSVWNAGGELHLDDYLVFLRDFDKKHRSKFKEVWYVNLDVIPGKQGESPTPDQIAKACEDGYKNYEIMRNEFDNVIHVYHEGDDPDYLRKMINEGAKYIGISPSNDVMTGPRQVWLDQAFHKLKEHPHIRTHGFAVTSFELMKTFDWFSVDSTSWFMIGMYGKLCIPLDRQGHLFLGEGDLVHKKEVSISERKKKSADGYLTLRNSTRPGDRAFITEVVDKYIDHLCKIHPITPEKLFDERNEARVLANLAMFLQFEKQGRIAPKLEPLFDDL
jgi:hypothetical protein